LPNAGWIDRDVNTGVVSLPLAGSPTSDRTSRIEEGQIVKRVNLVTLAVSCAVAMAAFAMPAFAANRTAAPAASRSALLSSAFSALDDPLCVSRSSLCADPYDNPAPEYVGHDEPSLEFKSGVRGSGNDITYTLTLPTEPRVRPTASGAGGGT
jgi:hypothetical protein